MSQSPRTIYDQIRRMRARERTSSSRFRQRERKKERGYKYSNQAASPFNPSEWNSCGYSYSPLLEKSRTAATQLYIRSVYVFELPATAVYTCIHVHTHTHWEGHSRSAQAASLRKGRNEPVQAKLNNARVGYSSMLEPRPRSLLSLVSEYPGSDAARCSRGYAHPFPMY